MKQDYVKPELKEHALKIRPMLKSGSRPGDQGEGNVHSRGLDLEDEGVSNSPSWGNWGK